MSSTRMSLEEVKARESRSRDDELEYFTVETVCLGCKKKLTAQVVELHGKLICPRCSTIMHMGPDGKWHKGPPPTYIIKAPKFTRWQRLCYRFPKLRNPKLQWGLGIGLSLLLIAGLAMVFWTPAVDLPPHLTGRARMLTEFVIADEYPKFKQCIAKGTRGDAGVWYDRIRAVMENSHEKQFQTSLGGVEVIFDNSNEGLAHVKTTLRFLPADPQTSIHELPLLLVWNLEAGKGWLLNGTQTLQTLTPGNGL